MKYLKTYASILCFLALIPTVYVTSTPYLSYFTSSDFTSDEGWLIQGSQQGIYSDCFQRRLLGGEFKFDKDVRVTKLIQLPPHYSITLTFYYWRIDNWDGEYFLLYIDQEYYPYHPIRYSDCFTNIYDSNYVTVTQKHVHSSVFICFTTGEKFRNYWGMRDIKLYVEMCPPGCETCESDSIFECKPYSLLYSSFIDDSINDGWFKQSGIIETTQCANIPIMGGYEKVGYQDQITKTLYLPSHNYLKIQIRLVLLDDWMNKILYIDIDNQIEQIKQYDYSLKLFQICGTNFKDLFYNYEKNLKPSNDILIIKIYSDLDGTPSTKSFGIRDIKIFSYGISNCGNGQIEQQELCDDGNLIPFDGCFNCQYSCLELCQLCLQGKCLVCKSGWELDLFTENCIQSSIYYYPNYYRQSNQLSVELCSINCLNCQQDICWLCNDGYMLNRNKCIIMDDMNFNTIHDSDSINDKLQISNQSLLKKLNIMNLNDEIYCQNECTSCIKGICNECEEGWEIHEDQCKIKCSEQMTVSFNQCNQSDNNIEQYGLSQCKLYYASKISISGWHINEKSKCQQTCNDIKSEQLTYYNQCNDSDYYDKEGCLECKQQCVQYCLVCKIGYCYQCMESYVLIDQNCEAICGDGLIALDQEECEDLNDIPYDGCYDCHYQCRPNCQQCFQGVCYDVCKDGYHMINDECYSICGDGVLSDIEECDDGNDVKDDGCYKCKYFCPLNCDVCEKGKCLECETGYQLINDKNYCQPICGDGLILTQKCDDKNTKNGDGCSDKCEIENNYVCKNFKSSPSQCTFVVQPQLILKFIEEKDSIQYISLTFSQEVLVDNKVDFSQKIKLSILNVDEADYTMKLFAINEPKQKPSFVEYSIQISFNVAFDEQPELDVQILYPLYNIDDAQLFNYKQQLKLKLPKYINDSQKSTAETISKLNTYTINSMGVISLIIVFFIGNPLLFGSVLEVLQSQSYLRFININFPINLNIYFESSNSISIQPILNYLNLLSMFNSIVGDNYVESNYKFRQYGINADLLTNISGQIFQIILFFSSYYFCIGMTKLINLIKDKYFLFLGQTLTVQIFKLQRKCLRYSKKFNLTLFKILLKANSWDLLFTSFLQISASQTKSYRSFFCNISAYFLLGSFVYLIITDLNMMPLKNTSIDCVWKQKYDLFTTLKKLVFITVLFIFQYCQELQVILLIIIQNSFLIYVYKHYPFMNKIGFINAVLQEGILFLFIVSSITFWDIVTQQINYEKLIIFGWIQMGSLSLVLLVNLLEQVKEIFLILKHFFQTKIQCKCQIKKSKIEEKEDINQSQIGAVLGSVGLQHTPQSISDLVFSPEQINPNQAQVTFAAQLTPNF